MGYEELPTTSETQAGAARQQRSRRFLPLIIGLGFGYLIAPRLFSLISLHPGQCHTESSNWKDLSVGSYKWWECSDYAEGVDCGYIIVPNDYHNASAGTTKIALARYKATKEPRQGIILLNPGGPGGPGTMLAGKFMQPLLGEDYDLVGFDPRGIGRTEPRVDCFGSTESRAAFMRNTVLDRSFDLGPNLTDPSLRENLLRQQKEADALYQAQFEICGKAMGEQLRYMGTTTVVRDIDFMTTVLEGEDALINYYGGSYGSILGHYLVSMFPGRVGRTSIDGIADATAWATQPPHMWYRKWLGYTDSAYQIFLNECSKAGPSKCALAKEKDEDPSAIKERMETFFDDLYLNPIPVSKGARPGLLTSGLARKFFFVILEMPRRWPHAAQVMADAIDGLDASPLLPDLWDFYQDLERSAVSCNDQPSKEMYFNPPTNEEIVEEMLDVAQLVTKFAWGVITTEQDSGCQYWYPNVGEPPERFTGPWNPTLLNPMLIVSNTDDPVTPISSARNIKKLLGDSAALALNNAPGHGTSSLGSLCIAKITRAYFANGTLPEDEFMCQPDRLPFDTNVLLNVQDYSLEDVKMLEALDTLQRLYESKVKW